MSLICIGNDVPSKNIVYQDSVYLIKFIHPSKKAEKKAEIGKFERKAAQPRIRNIIMVGLARCFSVVV